MIIFEKMKKHISLTATLIAGLIFLIVLQLSGCGYPNDLQFDTQNVFSWKFLDEIGVIPIKEVYYPHGFITYYAAGNLSFKMVYMLLPTVYFLIIFQVLHRMFERSRVTVWILLIFYYSVIINFINLNSYIRYGLLLYPAIFSSYLLSEYKKRTALIIIGIVTGIVIYLELGVGLNLLVVNTFLVLFDQYYIKVTGRKINLSSFLESIGSFLLGLGIGLLPLIIFLVRYNAFNELYFFIKDISAISVYAKSSINYSHRVILFILFSFVLNIGFLARSFKLRFRGEKRLYYYIFLATFMSLFFLVIKFSVRQMGGPMIFYVLFNIIILMYPVYKHLKSKYKSKGLMVFNFSAIMLLLLLMFSIVRSGEIFNNIDGLRNMVSGYRWPSKSPLLCDIDKLDESFLDSDPSYKDIYSYLITNKPGVNVFFYPNDPIFYIFLRQKFPQYPTTWASSPKYAQLKNIKYIEDMNVNTVVYNINYLVHDGVPNHVRNKTLHTYLMTNYHPVYKNSDFVVLERNRENDYFFLHDTEFFDEYGDLFNNNLDVNYSEVFYLEGKFRSEKLLQDFELVVSTGDMKELVNNINKYNDGSNNLILLLKYKNNDRTKTTLVFEAENGLKSNVTFKMCGDYYCLMRLTNIPLLYKYIKLINIETTDVIGEIQLIKTDQTEELW